MLKNSKNHPNRPVMKWHHHAYLIECLPKDHQTIYDFVLDGINMSITEIQKHNHDTLGIDAVRMLIDMYTKTTFDGISRRIAFITAETITHEAQNAMLKFFEETAGSNHFVVIIPSKQHLLHTFRSRFEELDFGKIFSGKVGAKSLSSQAAHFVTEMLPAERLKLADKIAEDLSDDKIKKTDILEFLHEVENLLTKKMRENPSNSFAIITSLEAVMLAEKYLLDRSSSTKILLENIALSLEL